MRRAAWALLLCLLPGVARAQLARAESPELAAAIAGRVCQDLDGDGRCAPEEPGLADIRLVLATGREVRTDASGRYHFAGVDARSPDVTGGVHLRPGRQRLRLDPRTLPPDSEARPAAVTVEVPWAAVVLQDFAVRTRAEPLPSLSLAYDKTPPAAAVVPGGVEFLVAGHASPGDEVRVGTVPAEVDERGDWRARVRLAPGENVLSVVVFGAAGTLRLFRQRIDVVSRDGGLLVIPREPEPVGVLRLPGSKGEPPASGSSSLSAEFPAGTRVRSPQGEVTVGPEGSALVPLVLVPGRNVVALEVQPPREPAQTVTVQLEAVSRALAVGLLDVEATISPFTGDFRLRGRGAAHGEARLGAFSLIGELDLRDVDVDSLRGRPAADWLRPRIPRLDRAPDPDFAIPEWGDESVGLTPNPAEGRLRLEVRHEQLGRVGLGTYRAYQSEGEVGRYHRPLFGPFAELAAELGRVRAGVKAFAGGLADPTRTLSALPAYEELRGTGGSLYYLGSAPVAEGSELLRVELRDGVTGLPLAERHLIRGRDYEIDYTAGRVLLARPLSFIAGEPLLRTEPLTAAPEPVLTVQYAVLQSASPADSAGGEAWAEWKEGRVSVSAVREQRQGAPYLLFSGHARTTLAGYTLMAEVARSRGLAVTSALLFGVSDDGGLSFLRPNEELDARGGDALGLRLRGPGLFGKGSVDAAFRRRTAGFSDGTHVDTLSFRQASLRVVQPLGPWRLTLLGDDRLSADPRLPFSNEPLEARTLGLGFGYERDRWGVGVELRDASLRASEVPGEGPLLEGGRTSAGLQGHYVVNDWLRVSAGHRQALVLRGEGPGRVDDTFSSAGVDVRVDDDAVVGVRGGWGPRLGPLAWLQGTWHRGQDVYYGSYSVDVDGPDFGASRAVSGASTALADGTSLFVEDVASHDANSVRLSRAVGFQQTLFGSFNVGARYERGVRGVLDAPTTLRRDVASLSGQLILARFRADGRVEMRFDRGTPVRGSLEPVDRLQAVMTLAAEAVLREDLSISGRMNYGRTYQRQSREAEARLLEGYAALAWRPGPFLVVARYGLTRELVPGERSVFGERVQQIISLLPAVRLGDRFALAAGLHVGRSNGGADAIWVFTGSLRPSVRVVGGLEVAVEAVGRSVAPENESLGSLRGEVAYRVDERMRVAAGYTLLGFTGPGLPEEAQNGSDRLYLRAELAY
ncbi:flagellar motor protein [Vitiosangium sp. GDMCC 1.1324]|uniref:flagellar motor protein n=1 Tax=Vitiosangium sp. (strain GDMCC 1.1324) TaxID=2138576 RepID=UPI000D397371|nr:flagellar motor protein [Vitiosangium sp. GDMCC 1.1324]PTL85246.1 flagellar motor protein [Vitiosangium sp. GDMCC 1.1324]